MGTVFVLPDLATPVAPWQDLPVGYRTLQVADYRTLVDTSGDFEQLVAATVALVRQLPQPVTLVGHGFGAFLALTVATTQFGRLDRLVLVAPAYQTGSYRTKLTGLHLKGAGRFKTTALDKAATLALYRTAAHRDLTNQLMHVQCRVDIFCGEQDRAHRQAATDLYHRLLEGHLTTVPQTGAPLNEATLRAVGELLR